MPACAGMTAETDALVPLPIRYSPFALSHGLPLVNSSPDRSHFNEPRNIILSRICFYAYCGFLTFLTDGPPHAGDGRKDRRVDGIEEGPRRRRRALLPQGDPRPANVDRRQEDPGSVRRPCRPRRHLHGR